MNVTFCYKGNENLGIEYLSAVLKNAGHSVNLVYSNSLFDDGFIIFPRVAKYFYNEARFIKDVIATAPDMVCFSVTTNLFSWAVNIAGQLKEAIDAKTVFGGIHATCLPEAVASFDAVDFVCVGEGEEAIVELAGALEKGSDWQRIQNLCYKAEDGRIVKNNLRPLIRDLDKLPLPDKDLFYDKLPHLYKRVDYFTATSRGCPYRCSYCCNHVVQKAYGLYGRQFYRRRSPENVIEELRGAVEKYRPNAIMFFDDAFAVDEIWLEKFCASYKKHIRLPFGCLGMSPTFTEGVVRILKDAGCRHINFGVQTANEALRRSVLKRPETNEALLEASRLINSHKIDLAIDHIFSLPGEGDGDSRDALIMYNRMRPKKINSFFLSYFPSTEIIKDGIEKNKISRSDIADIENGRIKDYLKAGKSEHKYTKYRLVFGLIPMLPEKVINFIIKRRIYAFLPGNYFFAFLMPRFIVSFFQKGDIRAKRFIKTYTTAKNYFG